MARGDDALAGREEAVSGHLFPPVDHDRYIFFKGYYLSIYNQQTDDYKAHINNETPTTEFCEYLVPGGYTTFIRGGTVYFKC
ncbi:hypothetical protein N7499_004136 [Penicillium canescens]|uniref:Uncharacterized protein n=1 Tax=Penicillium canescens TaxID=5083 RepID=A0AAD6N6S6_PENCN|nr:uncharacterized protein N7446_012162 [Penicillium canescens]KAJ6019952.1 hypothetical protein N7522_000027 [Penicillium canescens]KAJ6037880.1 hypothetical protein N7460_007651 [Penicillium canescens]KAJ6045298.1 hypothetical protein N7446_012162 [Penicillium canescens]KAJ6060999.1 hypothetical protein N7444_001695 [Penicillium canescens]KAJ6088885.1 hypothetical protein N7499_004136 [Penicillium canescens]